MWRKLLFCTIAICALSLAGLYVWESQHGRTLKAINTWTQKFDFEKIRRSLYEEKPASKDTGVLSGQKHDANITALATLKSNLGKIRNGLSKGKQGDNNTAVKSLATQKSDSGRDLFGGKRNGNSTTVKLITTQKTEFGGKREGNVTRVAIGMGITSRNMIHQPSLTRTVAITPFFTQLLPSFCTTASQGYQYHFYITYDLNDTFYNKPGVGDQYHRIFHSIANTSCQHLGTVELHFVRLNHSGRLVWAQNDAMMVAYRAGVDYFYRVNDDTRFITKNWTTIFIDALRHMQPPLVGVVGPNHMGGNTAIMTYDFVHRTHIDIFGYYYPRQFSWWYADDWITDVYKPHRSKKVHHIRIIHTLSLGQRYVNIGQPFNAMHRSRAMITAYLNKTGYHGH